MSVKSIGGNIFDSNCEAIVNPINCIGVMGGGLALEFKRRFPLMYQEYKELCNFGRVKLGKPYLSLVDTRKVINFPTKYHWKEKSRLSSISSGLSEIERKLPEWKLKSIAFPLLGAGLGGLDREMIFKILDHFFTESFNNEIKKLNVEIYL